MTTPFLGMDEWVESQNQPHVPVNLAARNLEIFAVWVIVEELKSEPENTSDEEDGSIFIVDSGTGDWLDHDNEIAYYSNGLKFQVPRHGMIAYVISDGSILQYDEGASDGPGWFPVTWAVQPDTSTSSGSIENPYVAGAMFNGEPTADLVIMRHPLPLDVVFPDDLVGSQGYADVAATAQTDFDIQKNGVSVGTMRFAAAATTATFIFTGPVTFSAGDVLTVVAPSSPDATLADIGFSLLGER